MIIVAFMISGGSNWIRTNSSVKGKVKKGFSLNNFVAGTYIPQINFNLYKFYLSKTTLDAP